MSVSAPRDGFRAWFRVLARSAAPASAARTSDASMPLASVVDGGGGALQSRSTSLGHSEGVGVAPAASVTFNTCIESSGELVCFFLVCMYCVCGAAG